MVSSRVVVLEVCGEVDLPRGEEEEDDDDELQHEHVGQAHAHRQAVSLERRVRKEVLVRFDDGEMPVCGCNEKYRPQSRALLQPEGSICTAHILHYR